MAATGRTAWTALSALALAAVVEAGQVPFSAARVVSNSVSLASSVGAADLDGDGDAEVLATSALNNSVCWWDNIGGDPGTWPVECLDTAFPGATAVITADLDGDDDIDVLAAAPNAASGHVVWWENGGNASSWMRRVVSSELPGAWWLEVGDVDGDDDIDIAAVSYCPLSGTNGNEVAWFENTLGDGSVWTKHQLTDSFACAVEVDLGDLDGDRDVDIVAAALDDGLMWWEQGAGGSWTVHEIDLSSDIEACQVVDLDGDGDLDVAGLNFFDNNILWWENLTGDGTDWQGHSLSSGSQEFLEIAVGDIDGDGDPDILGPVGPHWSLGWLDNLTGDAAAWDEWVIEPGGVQAAIGVHLADLDGDGDLDALAADFFADTITLWESHLTVFADGFESSDLSRWSSTGP